jgi:hypothetical protein
LRRFETANIAFAAGRPAGIEGIGRMTSKATGVPLPGIRLG